MPGSLADYAIVPATSVVRIPDHLSYPEAASLPIAATTAWHGIVTAGIRPGSTSAYRFLESAAHLAMVAVDLNL
jgi:NADPH:quinone reductase-like Zn-dependent oxidoreductase